MNVALSSPAFPPPCTVRMGLNTCETPQICQPVLQELSCWVDSACGLSTFWSAKEGFSALARQEEVRDLIQRRQEWKLVSLESWLIGVYLGLSSAQQASSLCADCPGTLSTAECVVYSTHTHLPQLLSVGSPCREKGSI